MVKKEGDAISPGDALCDIQTDKAIMAFEVEEAGILAKILVPDDTKDVKIGTLIALLVEEGEDWKDVEIPTGESIAPPPKSASQLQAKTPTVPAKAASTAQPQLGPAVRTLLDAYALKPAQITSSGPHGILLKGDILKFVQANKLKPSPVKVAPPITESPKSKPIKQIPTTTVLSPTGEEQSFVDVPNTNIRQVIARRLTESKTTIPHSYCTVDSYVDSIISLRKKLKEDGIAVSVNDFIIKAAAVALQRVPKVNAQWTNNGVQLLANIDVSVAVASDTGLITPIIKDAIGLGIAEISGEMKVLSDKARKGKLQPHEFMGGTFTISNLGMFGITEFSAIINPPQSAILAIGTSRLVLDEEGKPRTRMSATMSYDGRVFDEDTAAHFLEEFGVLMENPSLLLAALGPAQTRSSTVQL